MRPETRVRLAGSGILIKSVHRVERAHRARIRWPLGLSVLFVVMGAYAVSPLIEAVTGATPADGVLQRPLAYVLFAPLCTVSDALTGLSVPQHVALLGSGFVIYAVCRARYCQSCRTVRGWREILQFIAAFGLVVAAYAAILLLPRPMSALMVRDGDKVVVDFHSHTNASWDGRRSFDAAANRRWHHDAGFNVAYITDHATVAGANAAAIGNPVHAGDGTMLLRGVEERTGGEHILALNIDPVRDVDAQGDWHDLATGAVRRDATGDHLYGARKLALDRKDQSSRCGIGRHRIGGRLSAEGLDRRNAITIKFCGSPIA